MGLSNPYILFRNVSTEVNNLVRDNIDKVRTLSAWEWATKYVCNKGYWDYKNLTNSRFYVGKISDGKSGLFCLDGWNYKNTKLLRYDDVGNINYGATGGVLAKKWTGNISWIHIQELLIGGGAVQILTDAENDLKYINGALKFVFDGAEAYLEAGTLSFLEGAYQYQVPFLKQVSAFNEKLAERKKRGERNIYGDDPRDTYAIEWGYRTFN